MKNITNILLCLASLIYISGCSLRHDVKTSSPDGKINLVIHSSSDFPGNTIAGFSVNAWNKKIILNSAIKLNLESINLKKEFKIVRTEEEVVTNTWINNFGERKEIPNNYRSKKIFLESSELKINIICRVYNEGVAIAYEFPEQVGINSVTITDEEFLFRFPVDYNAWSAARAQAQYSHVPISKIEKGCERPLVIEIDSTLTIALAEAKLVDYARMKFEPDSSEGIAIRSRLASAVTKSLPFQSPWRVIMIGKNPGTFLRKTTLFLT